jgi:hypothetical protein
MRAHMARASSLVENTPQLSAFTILHKTAEVVSRMNLKSHHVAGEATQTRYNYHSQASRNHKLT